jgi:hypothetical protein
MACMYSLLLWHVCIILCHGLYVFSSAMACMWHILRTCQNITHAHGHSIKWMCALYKCSTESIMKSLLYYSCVQKPSDSEMYSSSFYENGKFFLLLNSSDVSGDYTCSVPQTNCFHDSQTGYRLEQFTWIFQMIFHFIISNVWANHSFGGISFPFTNKRVYACCMGFDPHSGQSKVRLLTLSIFNRQDCSGGSELVGTLLPHFLGWLTPSAESPMVGADVKLNLSLQAYCL